MSGFLIPNLTEKIFFGIIDFATRSSPTLVTLKSSFNDAIIIEYDSQGLYTIESVGTEFTDQQTLIFVSAAQPNGVGIIPTFNQTSESVIQLKTFDLGGGALQDPSSNGIWSIMIIVVE